MDQDKFRAIIIGAGPVGLYTAHALRAAGINYVVLERRKQVVNYLGSMVFTWPQTVRLFDQIGLYEQAKDLSFGIHVKKRVSGQDGSLCTTSVFWDQMHENHGYPFLPILRSDVVKLLFENLPDADKNVRADANVVDVKTYEDGVEVHLTDGSIERGSIVIGADGVHSKTRSIMNRLGAATNREHQGAEQNPMLSTFHGIVGCAPNEFGLENGAFYESRGGDAAIQYTVADDMIHYTTLKPLVKPTSGPRKYSQEELEDYAESLSRVYVAPGLQFEKLWAKTDKVLVQMLNQEEGFAIRWHHDRIVLLGDAAHKTTSISGLGLTCGLHSAAVLANELHSVLEEHPNPPTKALALAFSRYQQARTGEAREIWTKGSKMVREMTSKSWINRFWDSGVSQGIGKSLTKVYLSRPNTTVIGSVRNFESEGVKELKAAPVADGSKLLLVHIESASPDDPKKAADELRKQGIDHIDVVIANAGGTTPVMPLDEVSQEDMVTCLKVNVCGPLALFQAFKPLLQKSENPKWTTLSSVSSSLGMIQEVRTDIAPAYGVSKAGLNWITMAIYVANEWLTTLHLHPGLVQTGPGNWIAREIGLKEAPYTIDQSVASIIKLTDEAKRETHSGRLIFSIDETDMPW
ncbi:hypothetical protein NUW58_g10 [Xylaria curta]|uniref:Uncharacterized protein n=1 Tax=Xylaria curta TaxID=42375 RepID=A0ACC1PRA8_9PEZI|nr:hypothetical protein NUW58_g10 [Xylaria curta]